MAHTTKRGSQGKKKPACKSESTKEPEPTTAPPEPETPPQKLDPQSLVKKAYVKLGEKIERGDSKAIDDLVKLVKLEKDLDEDGQEVKEIKVRWESSEEKSSNEG